MSISPFRPRAACSLRPYTAAPRFQLDGRFFCGCAETNRRRVGASAPHACQQQHAGHTGVGIPAGPPLPYYHPAKKTPARIAPSGAVGGVFRSTYHRHSRGCPHLGSALVAPALLALDTVQVATGLSVPPISILRGCAGERVALVGAGVSSGWSGRLLRRWRRIILRRGIPGGHRRYQKCHPQNRGFAMTRIVVLLLADRLSRSDADAGGCLSAGL